MNDVASLSDVRKLSLTARAPPLPFSCFENDDLIIPVLLIRGGSPGAILRRAQIFVVVVVPNILLAYPLTSYPVLPPALGVVCVTASYYCVLPLGFDGK
jgi:hypothetical protein